MEDPVKQGFEGRKDPIDQIIQNPHTLGKPDQKKFELLQKRNMGICNTNQDDGNGDPKPKHVMDLDLPNFLQDQLKPDIKYQNISRFLQNRFALNSITEEP